MYRRQHRRHVHKHAQVRCYSVEGDAASTRYNFATHLVDMSEGGVCLLTVGRLRPGVHMGVEVSLPQNGGSITGKATVRWAKDVEHRRMTLHMAGLQFAGKPKITGHAKAALAGQPERPPEPPKKNDGASRERRRNKRGRIQVAEVSCTPKGIFSVLSSNAARSLVDVSRTGAQLLTRSPLEPGRKVKVKLQLPRFGDLFEAVGTVRWCTTDKFSIRKGRYFVGVEFGDLPKKSLSVMSGLERWFAQD